MKKMTLKKKEKMAVIVTYILVTKESDKDREVVEQDQSLARM
jgi:hypothetical protein